MAYITWYYYVFLAFLVAAYYLLPKKHRWFVLLAASVCFYLKVALWDIISFALFSGTILVCYFAALLIDRIDRKTTKKIVLFSSVAVISALLVYDKVINLLNADSLIRSHSLVVPIGLAFYTLQIIAYLVDVYMGKVSPQHNFLRFYLFISFFPQIIQGPIPRYEQLAGQLYEGHSFDDRKFTKALMLILWGFFLKLIIADKAGVIVDKIFDGYPTYLGAYVWLGGILYSIQLYTDFLACVTLSQGAAGLFGIELVNNFDHPYFSTSIKDFWRRWHISLSQWLRDYIYIPLGGNRKGKFRKYLNIAVTFLISGLWHGNGIRFIVWGLLHGIYQVVGDMIDPFRNRIITMLKLDKDPISLTMIRRIITFLLVTFGWIIFRADTLAKGVGMMISMFRVINPWVLVRESILTLGLKWQDWVVLWASVILLAVVGHYQEKGVCIRDSILERHLIVRWLLYIGCIVFIMILGTYGYGFDAQEFIYGGF